MPGIILETCQTVNPPTLMPGSDHCTSIKHNCLEVSDLVYASQPDLKCAPIENTDESWFTDDNSFMEKGIIKAGYGAPGWLSGLKPLPSAQVMVSGSWDQAPYQALCLAGSLLPPLSLPASLPTCDLCLPNK